MNGMAFVCKTGMFALSDKADKENTNTVYHDLIALILANLTVTVVDLTVIAGYLILIFQSTFEKKAF